MSMAASGWMAAGLCRRFAGLPWTAEDPTANAAAAMGVVCGACQVRRECHAYATSHLVSGFWAGRTCTHDVQAQEVDTLGAGAAGLGTGTRDTGEEGR